MPDSALLEAFGKVWEALERLEGLQAKAGTPSAAPAESLAELRQALHEFVEAHAEFARLFQQKYARVGGGR